MFFISSSKSIVSVWQVVIPGRLSRPLRTTSVRKRWQTGTMLETSARLLRLLSLFQVRRYWSGPDLASRLEITSRTLRRDVDKLRTLGYPIHSTSGTEGGYQLGAGSTMPPLLLDDEEAVAVALGLRYAAAGGVEGVEEASMRALSKIEQILPARLGRRVAALQSVVVMTARKETAVDARTLSSIASACRDHMMLRFRYRDYGGASSSRSVEPHRLVSMWRRWYLVAGGFEPQGLENLPCRSNPAEAGGRSARASTGSSVTRPGHIRSAGNLARSAVPRAHQAAGCGRSGDASVQPYVGLIEPIDEHSCYFETGAATFESLAMHLGLAGRGL